jgi:ferritin-like protein
MPEDSAGFHEPLEQLSEKVRDMHRAIVSVVEELQAIDWYAQRVAASADPELRAILKHNGDEEKEHAAMLLEWIRRQDPVFEGHLKTYLFKSGSIVGREAESAGNGGGPKPGSTIGSLRGGPR